jgi:hypothetical protein
MAIPSNYIRTIKGRPIDLNENAPSFSNQLLREAAHEYHLDQIVPHVKFLISEVPVSQEFWKNAYDDMNFVYKGNKVHLMTNHGSVDCMNAVIKNRLDISDWILDLSKLLGSTPEFRGYTMDEKIKREGFKKEISERTKNGIEKLLVE